MPALELERGAQQRTNAPIAGKLCQGPTYILAAQQADPFRVDAYRRAAHALLGGMEDLAAIFARGGRQALEAIPGIGISVAGAVAEMLTSGLFLSI